ncbi:hypothetical protein [Mycolicibacterium aubagnense]|uniref:Uncharacterized protein n=1 Tax=Mycolicibacterium aubagnense TaxID=319707 RepID=A0ABN5YWP5_9MYCO|nr:hypothetical protein [Mycolicibacterium aubagnense]TLH70806.1 hypothetical protein C1S80_00640 [Mycolicibacterium aubagnense]WGI32711.1 hypothetical protein QDT91_26765 [Mycolicibacterium aubagnense]BBX85665.1 hypothetical protein MAUB_35380 [Mycolicibacterium aubagnense]
MTDTPENTENPAAHPAGDVQADHSPNLSAQPAATGARSAWGALTRTTRIWTIALGAGAAALVATAGFGLGVFASIEHGDHERGDSPEASEYVQDRRDGPYEQRRREYDPHENDANDAKNADRDQGSQTGQPAGPGIGGGSSVGSGVEPKPTPVPPR